jgi:hypothetical protein
LSWRRTTSGLVLLLSNLWGSPRIAMMQ